MDYALTPTMPLPSPSRPADRRGGGLSNAITGAAITGAAAVRLLPWFSGLPVLLALPVLMALMAPHAAAAAAKEATPAAVPTPAAAPLFQEVAPTVSGLNFTHRLDPDHPQAYLYHSGFACGGVSVGDVNGDRRPDVIVVSGPDANAVFLNQGDLQFTRVEKSEVSTSNDWSISASLADVDSDGDLDLHVCNYDSPNQLFLNDGAGNFTEKGFAAGLAMIAPSLASYFSDFDGDGDLDLFVVTNRFYSPTGYPQELAWEVDAGGTPRMKDRYAPYFRLVTPPWAKAGDPPFIQEYGQPDRLFRNDGPGTDDVPRFRDITDGSGLENIDGHGLSALIFDANGDGRSDIFVANDYVDADRLWINQGADANGRIRFQDDTARHLPYTSWFSMGSDVADVNNDGRLDFMVGDMAATTHFKAKTTMGEMQGLRKWVLENGWPRQAMRNCLFINTGTDRWQESAFLSGVARSDWTWSVKFSDFDLDGRVDLFLTNGIARPFADSDVIATDAMRTGRTEWEIYKNQPEMREQNLAFRNHGDLDFKDVSHEWGLAKESMSYGAATGDLDGDGDVELLVCHLTENLSLYQNLAVDQKRGHWLSVRLDGRNQRPATGATVIVTTPTDRHIRLLQPNTGFLSGNEPVLHFGLGRATTISEVTVQWPSGQRTSLPRPKIDRLLVIAEPAAGAAPPPAPPSPAPALMTESAQSLGLDWKHDDPAFDDYAREFLLPGKLSQYGPGLAVADVNGDGRDDVFVGGAAGQSGRLFVTGSNPTFSALKDGPWDAHAASEDVAALFFDADRDGDADLLVVTGSTEWPAGDPLYADHLYLNETTAAGTTVFREAPAGTLPDLRLSGSTIAGSDVDQDGDIDVFIGSRSVPGAYPLTPESVLLRNESSDGGPARFTDATAELAPAVKNVGLVTAAGWSDVDADGWPDLMVASEWGSPRLFHNQQGKLLDVTAEAGLAGLTGWWTSLTSGDFDRDGDIDWAALNTGLNTKYGHPTAEKLLVLYHGDMDQNGRPDLIEAKAAGTGELPVRGRSCSGTAMPFIKDKFKTFKAFAASTLGEIYTPDTLAESTKVTASTLESGLLINESSPGKPRFSFRPLPAEAQLSPGFGAVASDVNADGWIDLCLTQNFYTREPETGLWRGGVGAVLLGGKNGFAAASPAASGFLVPGDGRGLAGLDLNHDGAQDLVALQNNDRLLAFTTVISSPSHQSKSPAPTPGRRLALRLNGPPGNPTGVGAKISLFDGPQRLHTSEVSAGSSTQSQSSASTFLTVPATAKTPRLTVRWPDGTTTSLSPLPATSTITASPKK